MEKRYTEEQIIKAIKQHNVRCNVSPAVSTSCTTP